MKKVAEKYYPEIDGELCVKMSPNHLHGSIASEISASCLGNRLLYETRIRSGLLSRLAIIPRGELCAPCCCPMSHKEFKIHAPLPTYAPYMPDLAVEVVSPSQTLAETRRKAAVYLRHGTVMVWLIDPERNTRRELDGRG